MAEKLSPIKEKVDLKELDDLPETIEDIEKHPILKPLLEFHKQATMLEKEDKIEANFLKEIKDDLKDIMDTGIYDNSNIVRKYQNLEKEYERLVLIYSRYTDLADEKIIELKRIVERYYVTKKTNQYIVYTLQKEIEQLRKELVESKKPKVIEVIEKIPEKELVEEETKEEEDWEDREVEILKKAEAELKEKIRKRDETKEKDEEEELLEEIEKLPKEDRELIKWVNDGNTIASFAEGRPLTYQSYLNKVKKFREKGYMDEQKIDEDDEKEYAEYLARKGVKK